MPNFKKEGRGFKMKGFSPFTKQIAKRNWEEEINPKKVEKKKYITEGKKKPVDSPTWEGTDEYRNPADIPASEYLERGLDPADYIPNYRKGIAKGAVKAGIGMISKK